MQRSLPDITARGLGLAAISYDSPAVLRAFTEKHQIAFPLLSDEGSKTISAWGLLNREATGRAAGIPHPGTFIIDTRGTIVSREFEQAYQERATAASILSKSGQPAGGSGSEVNARYLKARLGQSDTTAAPGHRITLTLDVTPGPTIHVYAPGQEGYIPIALKLAVSSDFKPALTTFPPSRPYFFAPLKETVKVYDRRFRISQDVTLGLGQPLRQRAAAREALVISGTLDYQACDDLVCYRPDSVAVSWKIALTPIER